MRLVKMFKLSGTKKIPKEKAATFGYKPFETENMEDVVVYVNTHAIIPCYVEDGHRLRENVREIYGWIRLDVDVDGESKKIDKALKSVLHIKKPSTSHKKNPYKWHYLIPIENVSQNYDGYKLQYYKFLAEFGIEIKDKSLASVVQNTNPMGIDGIELTIVNKGEMWVAPTVTPPKKKKLEQKHSDIEKSQIKKLLSAVNPDCSYEEWLKVGFALYDWCPKRGFKLFDKWSRKSDKYDGTTTDKWEDFAKNASGDITIGSLIHMVHGEKKDVTELFGVEKGKSVAGKLDVKRTLPSKMDRSLLNARKDQVPLFEGVVVQGMHSFIFGSAGANKTTLMSWIAIDILKRFKEKVIHFWSFDASQNHEKSIYDFAEVEGVVDRFLMSSGSTPIDYYEYYQEVLDDEIDLSDVIIIIDTFKFVSANINDKNANKKAFHFIKSLQKLGATCVSLGHTNKDHIKQSGTAEIEQDSEGLLRIDRLVDDFSKEVTLTISAGGRVRFNAEGVTFKSKPQGDGYKYLYSALETMRVSDVTVDIAGVADEMGKDKKKSDERYLEDLPLIKELRFIIENLTIDKHAQPIQSKIKHLAKIEASIGHSTVDRLLRDYEGIEWEFEPYLNENGGRRTKLYYLLNR